MEQDSPDVRSQEWTFSCCCVSLADWCKSLLGGHIRQHSHTLCSCLRLAALFKNVNQGRSRSKCRQSVESKSRPKPAYKFIFFSVFIFLRGHLVSRHLHFHARFFVFIYLCILHVHSTFSSGLPSASPLCSPTASYAFQFFSRPPSCLHINPHCILMFM